MKGTSTWTRYITDTTGAFTINLDTNTTGQPTNPTQTPHPYGWEGTNQRNNTNPSGLITMGARTYNPTTGRFLQTDPIPGGNQNPYTYPVDPINQQDLDGMESASSNIVPDCFAAGIGRKLGACLNIANRIANYVDGVSGDGDGAGRNSDDRNAMRHVMFSMLLSWSIGQAAAQKVLNAHEQGSNDYFDTYSGQEKQRDRTSRG